MFARAADAVCAASVYGGVCVAGAGEVCALSVKVTHDMGAAFMLYAQGIGLPLLIPLAVDAV